nr:hypothetical protein [Tanacetum cinerariifolium]
VLHKNLQIQLPPTEHNAYVEDIVVSGTAIARIFLYPGFVFWKRSAIFTAVASLFSGSGNFLLWQWEVLLAVRTLLVWNMDSSSKFYMYPIFLQLMINAQIVNLSSHSAKYTSHILIQKVFANMRRVGKGFSGVDTSLFNKMLVPQQVHDDVTDDVIADVADDVADADAEPTPPSPTLATTPPPS